MIEKAAYSKLFIGWCFLVADSVHNWMLNKPTDASPAQPVIPLPIPQFRSMRDFLGNDILLWNNIDWTSVQSINDGLFLGRRAPLALIGVLGATNGLPERDTDDLLHWDVILRKD